MISYHVEAADPVTRYGVTAQLGQFADLRLVARDEISEDTVIILAVDTVTDEFVASAMELRRAGCTRFLLVASGLDDTVLRASVDIGICAVVRRADATPATLDYLVRKVVRGESALPTEMLSQLFHQVSKLEHHKAPSRPAPFTGLTTRESQVLRLVAEGLDTDEIAVQLSYSSRTVKNILHAVTTRFCLRNRSHAVAYAVREGLI